MESGNVTDVLQSQNRSVWIQQNKLTLYFCLLCVKTTQWQQLETKVSWRCFSQTVFYMFVLWAPDTFGRLKWLDLSSEQEAQRLHGGQNHVTSSTPAPHQITNDDLCRKSPCRNQTENRCLDVDDLQTAFTTSSPNIRKWTHLIKWNCFSYIFIVFLSRTILTEMMYQVM